MDEDVIISPAKVRENVVIVKERRRSPLPALLRGDVIHCYKWRNVLNPYVIANVAATVASLLGCSPLWTIAFWAGTGDQ